MGQATDSTNTLPDTTEIVSCLTSSSFGIWAASTPEMEQGVLECRWTTCTTALPRSLDSEISPAFP